MRRGWIVALSLLAMGCAREAAVSPPQMARPAVTPGLMLPPARAETALDLRSFVVEAGRRREVTGATCALESAYFTGSFRTPARLVVPDLGPQSPVLSFACAAGPLRGTEAVRASLRGTSGLGGWPAVGISVGTGYRSDVGISVGTLWGGHAWGAQRAVYPDARVELR